jgi:hypothetical protein
MRPGRGWPTTSSCCEGAASIRKENSASARGCLLVRSGRSRAGRFDTYVRLAGALSLTLDDLLAGVTWTPGEFEFEIGAGYNVEFEVEGAT